MLLQTDGRKHRTGNVCSSITNKDYSYPCTWTISKWKERRNIWNQCGKFWRTKLIWKTNTVSWTAFLGMYSAWMQAEPKSNRRIPNDVWVTNFRRSDGELPDSGWGNEQVMALSYNMEGYAQKLRWKVLRIGKQKYKAIVDKVSYLFSTTTSSNQKSCKRWENVKSILPHRPEMPFPGAHRQSRFKANLEVILWFFGSPSFVPVSWMRKKQTAVSHCSTESEVLSSDAGLRMDGIPDSDLSDMVIEVLHSHHRHLHQLARGARCDAFTVWETSQNPDEVETFMSEEISLKEIDHVDPWLFDRITSTQTFKSNTWTPKAMSLTFWSKVVSRVMNGHTVCNSSTWQTSLSLSPQPLQQFNWRELTDVKRQSEQEGERDDRGIAKSLLVRNLVSLVPPSSSWRWGCEHRFN